MSGAFVGRTYQMHLSDAYLGCICRMPEKHVGFICHTYICRMHLPDANVEYICPTHLLNTFVAHTCRANLSDTHVGGIYRTHVGCIVACTQKRSQHKTNPEDVSLASTSQTPA